MIDDLDASLALHDELLARRGVEVWVGAEPTFTRADSNEPAWTTDPEGGDKLARAYALAGALADQLPGASVSRVIGRHVPGQSAPRFAFGVRWHDLGTPMGARAALDASPISPPSEIGGDHWLTIAPAAGVIEIDAAPCASALELARQARAIWRAAGAAGLAAVRHRETGDAGSRSGGAISLGGSHPAASPFVRYPHVLPALLRYLNNHPSLSYWFAGELVGSASPGPRPDEGSRERWDELELTLGWLEWLADRGELAPERLWLALSSLLIDRTGSGHHAEVNLDRLWNPLLPHHGVRHGQMGIVELRAVRMPERPNMLAALVVLFRSIVARLIVSDYRAPLTDWHDELHDQFALPTALSRDLRHVLGDLDEHGVGVPAQLRHELDAWRSPGITCRLGDATLVIRPALEFWPIVGSLGSPPVFDASTQRIELAIEGPGPDRIVVAGRWAHLKPLGDGVRAVGVRRRVQQPSPGVHPGLPAIDPLIIEWWWADRSQRIELWAERPSGGAYGDLPRDATEALDRRNERIVIVTGDQELSAHGHWIQHRPFTVDTRQPYSGS